MNDADLQIFFDKVSNLFPGKFGKPQAAEWAKYVRKFSYSDCESALSEYFASSKNPSDGAQPSLSAMLRILKRDKQRTRSESRSDDISMWESTRHWWASKSPEQAGLILSWNDDQTEMQCLFADFIGHLKSSGVDHNHTIRAYKLWQRKCEAMGKGIREYDAEHWKAKRDELQGRKAVTA